MVNIPLFPSISFDYIKLIKLIKNRKLHLFDWEEQQSVRRTEHHILRIVRWRDWEMLGFGQSRIGAKGRSIHTLSGQIHERRMHRRGENATSGCH